MNEKLDVGTVLQRVVDVYRSQFGLPACTTANGCFKKVNQNGAQSNYPRMDRIIKASIIAVPEP